MVSIKQGVENAMIFAMETLGEGRVRGIRLEEVDTTTLAGEEAWLITLSMLTPEADPFVRTFGKREYKSFTVLKSTGEVTSMKIRELADA